ncbi:hypothetical protein L0666_07945 [Octadecabacter sp. CECT 8868]|uniref:hypothetical protein n=1 Tax=Octadecabacter algicola TaxID=2909342 RepID=UPI00300D7C54|nr:hypothetical protein [Octadecabacter algicola]
MSDAFSSGLLLPAICLAALGWTVPRMLALWWPEGVKWLMFLALVSTLVMALAGAVVFVVIYAAQGVSLADLWATGGLSVTIHFMKLSIVSALLWGPLMILSLAGVPKNWVKEVW